MELSEVYYNDLGINVPRSKESIIRNAWKKNYNTLVTLQQPMRNRHQMNSRNINVL